MGGEIYAIVPSAGIGKRFDESKRKTFVNLNGIPLFIHTLTRLQREQIISEIIPVFREEDMEKGVDIIRSHNLHKIKRLAPGGKERQDSIRHALGLLQDDGDDLLEKSFVLVHDAVRPVIPKDTIENLFKAIKDVDGVAPGISSTETLKVVGSDNVATSTIDRQSIRAIQTPQVFPFTVIKKAYDQAFKEGYYATDDAALVERTGGRVKIIPGSPYNIKVTTPEDIEIIECILKKKDL